MVVDGSNLSRTENSVPIQTFLRYISYITYIYKNAFAVSLVFKKYLSVIFVGFLYFTENTEMGPRIMDTYRQQCTN